MKPIPADVYSRWSPMWASWSKSPHLQRPWWRFDTTGIYGRRLYARCDGAIAHVDADTIKPLWIGGKGDARPAWANVPALGLVNGVLNMDDFLATVDAADPLPVPPPMPGQVWATETADHSVCYSLTMADGRQYFAYDAGVTGLHLVKEGATWPPPNAILVAGPTPWGRDIPWSPAS